MSIINNSLLLSGDDAYNLQRSLRFRSSASSYLNRTPASAGNRKTWTWSAWVKRGSLGSYQRLMTVTVGSDEHIIFREAPVDVFHYWSGNAGISLRTTQVFRDVSAWYHLVVAVDTTQATSSNRAKIYVNGVQVTAFGEATYPSQNADTSMNNALPHGIGGADYSQYFDGYLTEVNFIDGQALTPSSFGSTNAQTGVWQPARYTGTYGTNGFYLPFTPASASYAGSFNGSNQTLQIPNHSSFNIGTNDYCMEGWFYFNTLGSVQNLWGTDNGSGSTPKFLALANTNGSLTLEFTNSGGVSFLVSSSGAVTTGKWHHIAYVRSSGTSSIYVDGVSVGSTSTSVNLSGLTQPFYLGWIGENYGSLFNGYISNFRYVTGSPVYTANFTPPTTALTAISGTQYLTLQNATIIDNSPNAFTITNNNGVSVSTANPFLFSVSQDFSGNGNNWKPNNISLTSGSTYDSMTDVPTLTSATQANYCVLNPLISTSVRGSITNGNLTVTSSANNFFAPATVFVNSGKWYAEYSIVSGANAIVGIMPSTCNPRSSSFFANGGGDGTGINDNNAGAGGAFRIFNYDNNGSVDTLTGQTYVSGDVIGIAMDLDNGILNFYRNGTIITTGRANNNAVSYTLSSVSPYWAFCVGNDASYTVNINFGQQPFAYTPPTGFVALNTYNLPTPTIGATASTLANKNFNPILYAGNSSARSLTGVGFQPDFVWIKDRTNARSHNLFDSVRGVGKGLFTDSTIAEVSNDTTGYVSSFDSDGYSVSTSSNYNGVNLSGDNYVAWNWKANGSAVSNTAGSITSQVSANTSAGFSVVTWSGNSTIGATVGHGLGVAPSMIIVKQRTGVESWATYHTSLGATKYIDLNGTAAAATSISRWNNTAPSSSVFTLYNDSVNNGSGSNYVAYCFSEIAGYSKFGSYTGNGSADGTFVYTGFRPRFVMIKRADAGDTTNWFIFDTSRAPYNLVLPELYANLSNAEGTDGKLDILSNGFKIRTSGSGANSSSINYIYMAFAETPTKFALAR